MPQNDVTAWLVAWGKGDQAADSRLMEAVYRICGVSRAGASGPNAAIIR